MCNKKERSLYCEFARKKITIKFDEEPLENGNGRNKIYETPTKCSESKCPKAKNCVYMQETSHWE